jgi:hypothetical protein
MLLEARTISSLVRDRLARGGATGRVHSVFKSSVNILCERVPAGAGPLWVSIHKPDVPMHPYAVLIRYVRAVGGAWPAGVRAGAFADVSPGAIEIGSRAIGTGTGGMTVSLRGVRVWPARLRPAGREPGRHAARDLMVAAASLGGRGPVSPFASGVSGAGPGRWGPDEALKRRCRAIRGDLVCAWRRGDSGGVARAMRSAVGLGGGLTPSGDDFLVGFLGAAHCFAYGGGAGGLDGPLGIERTMTTLPSFFMLKGALEGFLPEPLSRLLETLAGGDASRLRQAAVRLGGLGAMSGRDMLAGVICYLEAAGPSGGE